MGKRNRHPRARRRWRVAVSTASAAALVAGLAACSSQDKGVVINLYGGAAAKGFDSIIKDCNAKAVGKYTIVGNLLPSDADGQREQMVRRLAAKDKGMDLLGMDVTWTAEFAEAKWIRSLDAQQSEEAKKGVLAPPLATATWKDTLYGVPKHTNVQILWYRKSLVPNPPKTWSQLMEMSQKLKDEGKTYQISFTASQYEGYVVNVNNFFNAVGATFVNEDSTKATVNDKAVEALTLLKDLSTKGLTSASLSNAQEPEVFADLQNNRSAFAINWPYVLSAMRKANPKVAEDLGYTTFPVLKEGDTPKVTVGGMNYAISTFSAHPNEAFDAAMCLRSLDNQIKTAENAGDPPVMEAAYQDAAFKKVYPMGDVMLEELKNAVPRPVTPVYQNISTIVSTELSPPSAINPQTSAQNLQNEIQNAIDGKGILP